MVGFDGPVGRHTLVATVFEGSTTSDKERSIALSRNDAGFMQRSSVRLSGSLLIALTKSSLGLIETSSIKLFVFSDRHVLDLLASTDLVLLSLSILLSVNFILVYTERSCLNISCSLRLNWFNNSW